MTGPPADTGPAAHLRLGPGTIPVKAPPLDAALVLCILALTGCAAQPDVGPDEATPAHVARHRQALRSFDEGKHAECVAALSEWLRRYEAAHPELGASARFFIALSYREMGRAEDARAVFLDICRRYVAIPDGDPAAKWRRWALEELGSLGK